MEFTAVVPATSARIRSELQFQSCGSLEDNARHNESEDIVCLLDDKTLVENVQNPSISLISNLLPRENWYDAESSIQASSVDLHIGKIYIPGNTGKEEGSQDCPLQLHALKPGQTAIVSTVEELHLPGDIAAFGFPPNRVSAQGLLMTNPGHVDPGYLGPMRFTVINMGKNDYVLRLNDAIVTLLFMKLLRSSERDWLQRNNSKRGGPPKQKDLDVLSEDFLDITAKAKSVAEAEVQKAGIRLKGIEIFGGIATVILSFLVSFLTSWFAGVQDLKIKVAELDKSLNVAQVQQRMNDLEQKLKTILDTYTPKSQSTTHQPAAPNK